MGHTHRALITGQMADLSVSEGAGAPAPLPVCSVSFRPMSHPARPFLEDKLQPRSTQSPLLFLLRSVAPHTTSLVEEVLHTSFPANLDLMRDIIPKGNGFVATAIEAYNNHRNLIIRPDDVWLAIMTQFSFFVNANSEELRNMFVAHEGKRELEVTCFGNRFTMNTSFLVKSMMTLM